MKKRLILTLETLCLLVNRMAVRGLVWCEDHYPVPDYDERNIGVESARSTNVVHIPRTPK